MWQAWILMSLQLYMDVFRWDGEEWQEKADNRDDDELHTHYHNNVKLDPDAPSQFWKSWTLLMFPSWLGFTSTLELLNGHGDGKIWNGRKQNISVFLCPLTKLLCSLRAWTWVTSFFLPISSMSLKALRKNVHRWCKSLSLWTHLKIAQTVNTKFFYVLIFTHLKLNHSC